MFKTSFAVLCFALLIVSSGSFASSVKSGQTDDPNSSGYYLGPELENVPLEWKAYKSSCKKCKPLVDAYNQAMQQLMNARTARHNLSDKVDATADQEFLNKKMREYHDANMRGKKGTHGIEKSIAFNSELKALNSDLIKNELPRLKQLIKNLEATTRDLRMQIEICEEQCASTDNDAELGALGLQPEGSNVALPFSWQGPYPDVCVKCAKLALRLNSLPAVALKNLAELDAAEAALAAAQIEVKLAERDVLTGTMFEEFGVKLEVGADAGREKFEKAKRKVSDVQAVLKKRAKEYEAIKKNFNDTLALYNNCTKQCKKTEAPAMPLTNEPCSFAETHPQITIGANDEVGSGKAMTDKVKGQAKGMAMGALGGLMGGTGISMGGGGSEPGSPVGGGSKEPKLDKDPTSGPFETISVGGTDLAIRTGLNNEGFIVSADIKDSPGDGTFHAMWLEDGKGNIILPRRYLLIDIYRNWKLSVWWDYKRWQDGNLVEHRSGDSLTVGSDYLGTIALFEGAKGVARSIWNLLGFGTAVKGAKHIGAVFPASAVAGPCSPLKLVVHISLPKKDPVTTQVLVADVDTHAISDASPTSAPASRENKVDTKKGEGREGESRGGKRVRDRADSQND